MQLDLKSVDETLIFILKAKNNIKICRRPLRRGHTNRSCWQIRREDVTQESNISVFEGGVEATMGKS